MKSTKTIKVLSIGNSFSQDAQRFVHEIAKEDGIEIILGNLFIGGASLEMHWNNIIDDSDNYEYYRTGKRKSTSSIRQALESERWDFVTLQQASHHSGKLDTYFPYMKDISKYVKRICPDAAQLIHQTWAYEIDSVHDGFRSYERDQAVMFDALYRAYSKAAAKLKLRTIPCGTAVQLARNNPKFDYKNGGDSLCRDGYHAHFTLGRYLLSAVWYEILTGNSILENDYIPFDGDFEYHISDEELEILKNCAHKAVMLEAE